MTGKAEWGLVVVAGRVVGVHSLSQDMPIKVANFEPAEAAFAGRGGVCRQGEVFGMGVYLSSWAAREEADRGGGERCSRISLFRWVRAIETVPILKWKQGRDRAARSVREIREGHFPSKLICLASFRQADFCELVLHSLALHIQRGTVPQSSNDKSLPATCRILFILSELTSVRLYAIAIAAIHTSFSWIPNIFCVTGSVHSPT